MTSLRILIQTFISRHSSVGRAHPKYVSAILDRYMNTNEIGTRSVGIIIANLIKAGTKVSLPIDGSLAYDLIADTNGSLARVQCKTGRVVNGAVLFKTSSISYYKGEVKSRIDYIDKADLFAVYCESTDKVYVVPVKDCPSGGSGCLRIDPSKNNQTKGVKWAKDYELKPA